LQLAPRLPPVSLAPSPILHAHPSARHREPRLIQLPEPKRPENLPHIARNPGYYSYAERHDLFFSASADAAADEQLDLELSQAIRATIGRRLRPVFVSNQEILFVGLLDDEHPSAPLKDRRDPALSFSDRKSHGFIPLGGGRRNRVVRGYGVFRPGRFTGTCRSAHCKPHLYCKQDIGQTRATSVNGTLRGTNHSGETDSGHILAITSCAQVN
jgi:hypothetical protein